MKKIIRRIAHNAIVVEFHYSTGGTPDFFTARAYERQEHFSDHAGRIFYEKDFWGDLAYPNEETTKKQKRKSESDIYRLIDTAFPELLNKGLRAGGYAKFTIEEMDKSGLSFTK